MTTFSFQCSTDVYDGAGNRVSIEYLDEMPHIPKEGVQHYPADTRRKNNVIMTLKRRRDVVLTL